MKTKEKNQNAVPGKQKAQLEKEHKIFIKSVKRDVRIWRKMYGNSISK